MDESKTLYVFDYFDCEKDAERWLRIFADDKRPLVLPENQKLRDLAMKLNTISKNRSLTAKDLLYAYQELRESHAHTDVFCGWRKNGKPCGGQMDIQVEAVGAYYQCKVDSNHRTPK